MKKNKSILLSGPYILWMLLFTLIPLGVMGYYALTDPDTGAFTLNNLRDLGLFLPTLGTSVWYSVVSAIICLLLGYPVAYFIAHRSAVVQKILYMLVMLPMCMSFLLRTLAWVGLLETNGIINVILGKIGLGSVEIIGTSGAVILGMVYNYLPYMILPLYAVIVKIDNRLIEAAEDLGCNGAQVFGRVILPLSMPGILSGITMVFVPAVSTFYISQKLGGAETMLIGDVIEKQFKSDVICLGLYGFKQAEDFLRAYRKLNDPCYPISRLYLSHVISYLIGYSGKVFRYVAATEFENWSDERHWNGMQQDYGLYFIDLDGQLSKTKLLALQNRGAAFVGYTVAGEAQAARKKASLEAEGIRLLSVVSGCPWSKVRRVLDSEEALDKRYQEL